MHTVVIKTLPHLQELYLQQNSTSLYAQTYSIDIEKYLHSCQVLSVNQIKFKSLIAGLKNFNRVAKVAQLLDFSVTGDLVSIWPIGYPLPIKLDFFGDQLESVYTYNQITGSKVQLLKQIILGTYFIEDDFDKNQIHISDYHSSSSIVFTNQTTFPEQSVYMDLQITYPNLFWSNTDLITKQVNSFIQSGYKVYIISKHAQNLPKDVAELVSLPPQEWEELNFMAGFVNSKDKQVLLTDRELFGSIFLTQRSTTFSNNAQKLLAHIEGEIQIGNYLVHSEHGVGLYTGLTQEVVNGTLSEYLELKYAGDDMLLVPINQLNKLTKFIGNQDQVKLNNLSGSAWSTLTARVKKLAQIKAAELIEHYARKELGLAVTISNNDTPEYLKFLSEFEYSDTTDQQQATLEVIADLQTPKPMNRLLVGDVGFGKTEVAMRAAFKILESGKQVAVLCPTTILAAQHWKSFNNRFAGSGYKIYYLSRAVNAATVLKDIQQINLGSPCIVIGTHRLLSSGLSFASNGLLIIDEEQRFGVKQKEQVRKLNYNTHYLSISATPIPRTLSIALSGMQSISIIATPPKGRKPIITQVIDGDWNEIKQIIQQELNRDGQVYFVHNQVASIQSVAAQINLVLPGVAISIAHGQMPIKQIEQAMQDFYSGKSKILLASAIIENGLDVKGVNTMIINQANKFGLSSLYQLRGRVGRGNQQAYCYLVYNSKAATVAQERLDTLALSSNLGSGFSVASKDLELRGAGELLGAKQSGHISKVGYALYMQLLAQEIDKLKAGEKFALPEFVTL